MNRHICPCGGNTLDRLVQPSVLIALAKCPLHGYRLAEQLGELPLRGGRAPDMAGIYRTLQWMEKRALVSSNWVTDSHGPAKKTYTITDRGRQCLAHWVETLEDYRRGLARLLREARKVLETD
ncbi:MAG: helix-turn-helix transcriptional regulator [Planctomycetota bacterium]